jgi:hypothetical protein
MENHHGNSISSIDICIYSISHIYLLIDIHYCTLNFLG